MRFLTPFFIVFFATVVYSKKWREYGYRECCSCEDRETPNNKWTVTKKEIQKPGNGGEGGGGGEEEGGGGIKKGGRGDDGGGDGEEEDSKRRRHKKITDGGSQEEGAKGRKSKKGRSDGSEEEDTKRRRPEKAKGEGSEEEGAKRRRHKKGRGEGSEEEGSKRPSRKKGKGGGGEEEGAMPPGSGETGGSKGGLEEDGYKYHEGVISGDNEPDDFKGKFTKAMRQLQREVLKRHNKWRKLHGVPPVEHSEELSRYAQAYAYSLARQGVMKHRKRNDKYGENLYYSWSSNPKHHIHGKQVVDAWYDEIKMYHWGNTMQRGCGHFTQVVWRTARKIGSGIARYKDKIFVVTNYDPPGNVMGRFLKNVPRPGSPPSGGDEGGGNGQEGGGGEEGGGKGHKGGEGDGKKDDYLYHSGVISGDNEPDDFKGKFTKAMLKLQRQVLKRHNKWRKLHGVPPVENSEELSRYAQAYAYSLARQGVMKHRSRNKKYGENLFYAWSSSPDHHVHGKQVVDAWYDEIKMYHWGNTFQRGCGHFTQVVWRTARKIGSGIAKYKGKIFVVTNYDPPGNVMGRFLKNVPKPGSPPSGGDEGGGKGQEGGGGEGGGGKGQQGGEGGEKKDDYFYHNGVIRGVEPTDFNGQFTKAMRKLQRQVLRVTNKYRRRHGVPPLEHSEQLCRYAQAYAFYLAKIGQMVHRSRNKKYGENLFYGSSTDPNYHVHGRRAVDGWYDEIKLHRWTNAFQYASGHFTQLIWKSSRYLGSGIAKYNNKIFIVSNYDPPGNVQGLFLKNCPRPVS